MAPSYSAPNALLITTNQILNGTFSFSSPAPYSSLSLLASSGSGTCKLNYTIHYADSSVETGTFTVGDWFNGPNPAWVLNGRANAQTYALSDVSSGNPKLYSYDLPVGNTASAVTSIDFAYVPVTGGPGRGAIFAVSGAPVGGGNWAPIAVTGYNFDMIIEAGALQAGALRNYTTVSMDGGTANTGNTWFEQGWDPRFPNVGLPHPGTTINSTNLPDHHYLMPASYANNNAIYVDSARPIANITLEEPRSYSALSFLNATANGGVTNQCIMQYDDGTSETKSAWRGTGSTTIQPHLPPRGR